MKAMTKEGIITKECGYCNQPLLFWDRQKADSQEAINTHHTNGPVWQPQFPALVLQVNNSSPLRSQIVPWL